MGFLARQAFGGGWQPDADAVNAPLDALLRMDNLVLDERGVLALRAGSTKINGSPFADLDVHSLFTVKLSGTRYRMSGAGSAVYANGVSIASGFAGSGDIAFHSYLGQILAARSTSKKKYDGTTVRNWGISMTGGAPTIAAVTADKKVFASCDNAEVTWADNEVGSATTQVTGQDGTANGAKQISPATTGRGTITRTLAADTDYTVYDSSTAGTDDDLIELYIYLTEPLNFQSLRLMIDVNSAAANAFQEDYYTHDFFPTDIESVELSPDEALAREYTAEASQRARVRGILPVPGSRKVMPDSASIVRPDFPVGNAGWSRVSVRRGKMTRVGSTAGKDWSTVRGIRFVFSMLDGSASSVVRLDDCRITSAALNGAYKWRFVYVRNDGVYTAKSAPSASSAETTVKSQSSTVNAPADASRDSQANEIWGFRMGGNLDGFYRTIVKTGVSGTGAVAMTDTLSDRDALIANIRLETDNATPPDNIIDIDGPYFDRVVVLTSDGYLYPSRRRNPDSFSAGQAVRVTGTDETPYWVKKAIGGLYIGTSKDIYVLDGDGAELADGTINFTLRALNVDHAPISDAVAQEGNLLVYLAHDGWRAMSGAGSQSLVGATSLLYRGQTRHGVSSVALATGRFRAAIAKGQLVAVTPEGASTTSSSVLYRHVFSAAQWYRHTYGAQAWRCLHREPDGTLIASDTAGYVWTLDTGTQDNGSNIAVVLWSKVDDDAKPFQRKDPWDLRARLDTGGATASIDVHLDGSATSSTTLSAAQSGMGVSLSDLSSLAVCRQVQLRVTGSFSTFRWYDSGVGYRDRPALTAFVEPKPEMRGTRRRRFAGGTLIMDTLGGAATVTPVIDDVEQAGQSVTTSDVVSTPVTFANVVGRDLWFKIAKATGFEYHGYEPIIVAEFPPVMRGRIPDSTAGYHGPKLITGLRVRACTLGSARTFTPILDGTSQSTTFALTTSADDPDEVVHSFAESQIVTDIAFSVDGNIELYDWAPLVDHRLPLGRKLWDSGPIDLGTRAAWVPYVTLKAKLTGDITVTPYVDDVVQTPFTVAQAGTAITTYDVLCSRPVRGRQIRFVVSSESTFHLYWLEPRYRITGGASDLRKTRVAVGV